MVDVGLDVFGQGREEVRDAANLGWLRRMIFGRRILRRNIAERWTWLEELEKLRRELVGHGLGDERR